MLGGCWGVSGVSGCPHSLEWQRGVSQACQCPGLLGECLGCVEGVSGVWGGPYSPGWQRHEKLSQSSLQ